MNSLYQVKETQSEIVIEDHNGRRIAYVAFQVVGHAYELYRVHVADSLRGQGVGGKLMELFYEKCKKDRKNAILVCSYAVKWFDRYPEKCDVL